MKKSYNDISFSDHDYGMGSKIKLLPILLVILLIAAIGVGGYFGYKFISTRRNAIESIYISSTPDRVSYYIGEQADYAGLEITATRKNGKKYVVALEECKISGFSTSEEVKQQAVIVEYEGHQAQFWIEVSEIPGPTPTLVGISLETMPKTQYKVGEWLDTDGGVILRTYDNGEVKRINLINGYVRGFAKVDGPGEYVMTVEYSEGLAFFTLEYTITVTD